MDRKHVGPPKDKLYEAVHIDFKEKKREAPNHGQPDTKVDISLHGAFLQQS